jgi:hypothetical protein
MARELPLSANTMKIPNKNPDAFAQFKSETIADLEDRRRR